MRLSSATRAKLRRKAKRWADQNGTEWGDEMERAVQIYKNRRNRQKRKRVP